MSEKEYTSTLHLPKTDFQMKANLPTKEPKYIKKWTEEKIYEKGLEKNKNGETFILHDGPPYANGNTHIGHALNKILKDIIVKYKTFRGFKSPYVPGWDTHGLPIELQVVKEVGVSKAREMSALEIRKLCEKYAKKWVGIQKEQFIRLGVLGDWDNPYLTLDPRFEAKQLELFGEIYENGYIFKGLKPVYWSPATETALAEAEIEYYDHTSPSIYVRMQANKDLLDKIDGYVNKFNSAELSAQFYIPHNYMSLNGRSVRNYLITKKGVAQLIGGYNSAVPKAFELNVMYINEFERMENYIKDNENKKDLIRRSKNMVSEVDSNWNAISKELFRWQSLPESSTLIKHIPYSRGTSLSYGDNQERMQKRKNSNT